MGISDKASRSREIFRLSKLSTMALERGVSLQERSRKETRPLVLKGRLVIKVVQISK